MVVVAKVRLHALAAVVVLRSDSQRLTQALDGLLVCLQVILAHHAGAIGELKARLELTYRSGVVCQDHLQAHEEAVECLRETLAVAPQHDDSRQRMETYLGNDDHKVAAAGVLLPVYEAAAS